MTPPAAATFEPPSPSPSRPRPRALAVLLVAVLALALASCKTELYQGMSQREANEMVAALARAGIAATREQVDPNSFRVMVAEADLPAAVDALARVGLPREQFRSLGEIFPGDGLIVSPYEQRVRTMFALNQEIGRTISMIDGVVNARVHVVLPDLDLRGQPMNRPSASIVVTHAPEADVEDLGSRIRLLVANAVQGLTFREVAVAFFPVSGLGEVPLAPAAAAQEARPAEPPVLARGPSAAGTPLDALIVWLGALSLTLAGVVMWLRDRARARARRVDAGGGA